MDISLGGLGFGLSYSISVKAELLYPESPFSLVGRVSYLSMSGSGTLTSPVIYSQGTGNVEAKLHLWSIGVGGEWKILQGPVAPFIGASALLESFNNASYELTNSARSNEYLHGRGTDRGVGLEIGAQLTLTPRMRLDISEIYNLHSLFSITNPNLQLLASRRRSFLPSFNCRQV